MFPERLRALRLGAGLSLSELAQALNQMEVSYSKRNKTISQIGKWERGTTTPSYLEVLQLAEYFQVSLDYLGGRSYDNYDLNELLASNAQLSFQQQKLTAKTRGEIYALIKGYLNQPIATKQTTEEISLDLGWDHSEHK